MGPGGGFFGAGLSFFALGRGEWRVVRLGGGFGSHLKRADLISHILHTGSLMVKVKDNTCHFSPVLILTKNSYLIPLSP